MTITTIRSKGVENQAKAVVRYYATGRRKSASARVWLSAGSGGITVNGKDISLYFTRTVLRAVVCQPLVLTDSIGQYDVRCTVSGGGLSGQAGAVKHGISRALDSVTVGGSVHSVLRKAKCLTRDDRRVERKKYGRVKARKKQQFSKR